MVKQTALPKNYKRCVFCKSWNGNADLVFRNPQLGYQFTSDVRGKCMKNGSTQAASGGSNCRSYEPSYEASKSL